MDETLIHAWRSGDRFAQRRCLELITGLVHALVEGVSSGFEEMGGEKVDGSGTGHRHVKVSAGPIAQQIMSRGPAPWREIRDRCVSVVARAKVGNLTATDEEVHPSIEDLVVVVLNRDRNPGQSGAVKDHAMACANCTDHLRVVRALQRVAENWTPAPVEQAHAPTRPKSRVKRARRKPRSSSRRNPRELWPSVWSAWPIFALFILFTHWAWKTWGVHSQTPDVEIAVLVDRTPPEAPRSQDFPAEVFDVIRDLRRGDCWTASVRLRGIRKQLPEDPRLRLLEGSSFVCAGNGAAAEAAVSPLLETYSGSEPAWIAANAALLQGKSDQARALLEMISVTDSTLRPRAETLLIRLDVLTDG
jgi:hypothetical protein